MIKTALVYALCDWCLDILFGSLDRVFNPEDVYKFKVGDKLYSITWSIDTNNISFLESTTGVMKNGEVIFVCSDYVEVRAVDYGFLNKWSNESIAEEDYFMKKAKYKGSHFKVKLNECYVACRKLTGRYVDYKIPINMIQDVIWN